MCATALFVYPADAQAGRPDTAPKIVNWNYAWSVDSVEDAETLALWDVLIMDVENATYSHDQLAYIKTINPDIKLLAYISLIDIRPDASSLDQGTLRKYLGEGLDAHEEWIVHTANGSRAEWWPEYTIMNIANADFRTFFVDAVTERIIEDEIWDGVFYDNLWESVSFVSATLDLDYDGQAESSSVVDARWVDGISQALQQTRAAAEQRDRTDFIITGNGGTEYYEHVDGVGFEHFPNTVYGGWTDSMEEYFFITRHLSRDPYALINTNVGNTQQQDNYQAFRFGLTSTLLGDGYYSFDSGDQTHHERWYYDEYSIMLGEPVSEAYNIDDPDAQAWSEGVWRRDFEHASVFVNSSHTSRFIDLKVAFEKIQGTQDTATNSGELVGSIQLPAHDGIIMLKRFSEVRQTTYLNGAYAKVFDRNGNEERNSFFAYTPSFASYTQIHRLKKKTIVADSTTVRVYSSSGLLIKRFAPYGEGYSGGIDIAIGKTKKGKTVIVTGNMSGRGQVKLFSLTGAERAGSGCSPFGDFDGGIDVAAGNNNRFGRLEIAVGAGRGGGPQVVMVNGRCRQIYRPFFAYDTHYRTGVHVALGDTNGDGRDEVITAPGEGGGPQVRIFTRRGKMIQNGFFAYETSDRSGVWLSTADIDDDGIDEIITNNFSIFDSF